MLGKNRFMPVHAPHPMNSVVRDDYYDSDNPSIAARRTWQLREGRAMASLYHLELTKSAFFEGQVQKDCGK